MFRNGQSGVLTGGCLRNSGAIPAPSHGRSAQQTSNQPPRCALTKRHGETKATCLWLRFESQSLAAAKRHGKSEKGQNERLVFVELAAPGINCPHDNKPTTK